MTVVFNLLVSENIHPTDLFLKTPLNDIKVSNLFSKKKVKIEVVDYYTLKAREVLDSEKKD
jgi:hypothetical protein